MEVNIYLLDLWLLECDRDFVRKGRVTNNVHS